MPDDKPELLTVKEVSAWLGIPVATLNDWRLHGRELPYVKVGKHVRYERAAIAAYLDAQRRDPS